MLCTTFFFFFLSDQFRRFLIGKEKSFPFLFNPRECTFRGHYNPKEVDRYLKAYKEQKLGAREFADITLWELAHYKPISRRT